MKYFLLIIRHLFPRKHWKTIKIIPVYDYDVSTEIPTAHKHVMQDQFGNLRTFKP